MPVFDASPFQLTYDAPLFWAIVGFTGVLVVLAFVFTLLALFLHLRNRRRERWEAERADAWKPALLDVLAGDLPAHRLQQQVRPSERRYFVNFIYRFARRVRGKELAALQRLADPFLKDVAASWKTQDAEHRARDLQTLGLLGFQTYLQDIIDALDDPSPLVAMVAARALARRQHTQYAHLVLDKLHHFEAWRSESLASLLANLGVDVAPALRDAVADSARPTRVRAIAADALRKLNDAGAAETAARILNAPADRSLQTACLRLIKEVGRPEHLSVVRRLANSNDFVLRIHAIGALGRIGGPDEADRLRQAVTDSSEWVAIQAVQGLKEMGETPYLRNLAASDHARSPLARQALIEDKLTVR